MKSLILLALFAVLAISVFTEFAWASTPNIEDAANAVDPNCQAACYQGRAAFIAWCKTMGPGAPCLALANAPPQIFTTQACLRYCNM